jgi:hypothetical protein
VVLYALLNTKHVVLYALLNIKHVVLYALLNIKHVVLSVTYEDVIRLNTAKPALVTTYIM